MFLLISLISVKLKLLPCVRWGRGFGWGAASVCLCVCLLACSGWVAACWLFLVLSKERRRGRATHPGDHHEIYDIGTKILYFLCFVTTDMFLFCKPIIFSGNCRIFRDLAFGSVKTRFKAFCMGHFFEHLHAALDSQVMFFMNFCPRRATKVRSL